MSGPDDTDRRDEPDPGDEASLRAAEFALGLLSGPARRDAERRRRLDAAFAEGVMRWDERLAPLIGGVEPVDPPPTLWEGIEGDLARMTRAAPPRAPERSGGRVAAFWRPLALGTGALLAASLAGIAILSVPEPAPEPMTASIVGEGSVPLYTAVVYPGAAGATLIPVSTADAPGHSHELWIIAPGDAPHSLGVLRPGTLRIEIAPELLSKGGVLAISLEPLGGSPTGQPTGPVVAKGELSRI